VLPIKLAGVVTLLAPIGRCPTPMLVGASVMLTKEFYRLQKDQQMLKEVVNFY
jgi:hypothetical protein